MCALLHLNVSKGIFIIPMACYLKNATSQMFLTKEVSQRRLEMAL